jgi:hypothetical protein
MRDANPVPPLPPDLGLMVRESIVVYPIEGTNLPTLKSPGIGSMFKDGTREEERDVAIN